MLSPTNVTLAQMNTAILAGNRTHMRLVFPVQNITLTDDNIAADGGLVINALMNPDTDLVMGKAVASEVVVRLLNGSVFTGFDWTEEFHVDFGVEIGNSTEWVTLGYFTGKKPKRVVRVDTIEFSAVDRMQKFNELADDFIAGLTFPLSVEDIFQALCTYVGLNYVAGDEIADIMAMTYSENPFNNGITCRDILSYIAEANCCYARITAGGDVKLAWFSNQTANYTLSMDDHFGIDIDEEVSPAVDSVRICSSDDSISGAIYPVGSNNVIYEIIDNPLLLMLGTADRTTALTDILARLSAFGAYTPASVNAVGNPMVETGDIIAVQYDGNQTINLPIFVRGFGWNGACGDMYECTGTMDREMTPAVREQYAEGGKLSNKYTIVSGIDINDQGVDISGNRYLKLRSGGILDVDAQNFKIKSDEKYIQMENWKIDENGLAVEHDVISPDKAVFSIIEKPVAFDGSSNPYKELYQSGIYYTYTVDQNPVNYRPTIAMFGRNKNEKPLILKFSLDPKNGTITIAGETKSGGQRPPISCLLPFENLEVSGDLSGTGTNIFAKKKSLGTINNSKKRITFGGTVQFLLVVDSLNSNRSAMFICYGRSNSSCVATQVYCGSNITVTTGTGYIDVNNSNSNNANVFAILLDGNLSDIT